MHSYTFPWGKIYIESSTKIHPSVFGKTHPRPPGKEYGKRIEIKSPWGTSVTTALHKLGYKDVRRVERTFISTNPILDPLLDQFYPNGIVSFKTGSKASDDTPISFEDDSEHSRHHFFKGIQVLNGKQLEKSLFDYIQSTNTHKHSVLKFCDNASAISGTKQNYFCLDSKNNYGTKKETMCPTFTAETHNHPCYIEPYHGATTAVGGRLRDSMTAGTGSLILTGVKGYCVQNNTDGFNTLIKASNGCSDYANMFGEPCTGGFITVYGDVKTKRRWVKPIVFSAGAGIIPEKGLLKKSPEIGDRIVRIGGPVYPVGIGGSIKSSGTESSKKDISSVQRGDPQMGNKLYRVVRSLVEQFDNNPVRSIHDQGAGGMGNVLQELVHPKGADIDISKVTLGSKGMSFKDIWISEHQEQNSLLIKPKDIKQLYQIAKREDLTVEDVGHVQEGRFIVNGIDIKKSESKTRTYNLTANIVYYNHSYTHPTSLLSEMIKNVLKHPTVGSKRFIVEKVDRSVGGLTVQQQSVGLAQVPCSDYSLVQTTFGSTNGIMSAIGTGRVLYQNPERMVQIALGEAMTNAVFCKMENFACQGNWMWSGKDGALTQAVLSLSTLAKQLDVPFDGGKDSLSMKAEGIKSPDQLVVSLYGNCPNITNRVTPAFKKSGNKIYLLTFSDHQRCGGSILDQIYHTNGQIPMMNNPDEFKKVFNWVQGNLTQIASGHDRSDGGLLCTLCEMCFAGQKGAVINLNTPDIIRYLFNEELGLVIESEQELPYGHCIGNVTDLNELLIKNKSKTVYKNRITKLQKYWETPSRKLDLKQTKRSCVVEYYNEIPKMFYKKSPIVTRPLKQFDIKRRKTVVIVREQGCNSDRELAYAFYSVGFKVLDRTTDEILQENFDNIDGIAFCGGFSFSDVLGAGKVWAERVKTSESIEKFRKRKDTFILGVCNGCQLLGQLGWIPSKLYKNQSGRFESRISYVRINTNAPPFFTGMKGCILPIWTANGEGRFVSTDPPAVSYTNFDGNDTMTYPYNPNGSINAAAGLLSENGRILGIMPHPERNLEYWKRIFYNLSV